MESKIKLPQKTRESFHYLKLSNYFLDTYKKNDKRKADKLDFINMKLCPSKRLQEKEKGKPYSGRKHELTIQEKNSYCSNKNKSWLEMNTKYKMKDMSEQEAAGLCDN